MTSVISGDLKLYVLCISTHTYNTFLLSSRNKHIGYYDAVGPQKFSLLLLDTLKCNDFEHLSLMVKKVITYNNFRILMFSWYRLGDEF